jgi:uracil-DNA glycosylase family 4
MYQPPSPDCPLCPRLVSFREQNKQVHPSFFNGAVPSFGDLDAELLIVGLAPGLKGANATGRPFTNDYAGDVLYGSLLAQGFARGEYKRRKDDGLQLLNCRITNAVRCVPPENKPETFEVKQCNQFLKAEIAAMPRLRVILSLGGISHKAVVQALGLKQSAYAFAHAAQFHLPMRSLVLLDSYHCSRYNINTNRVTPAMIEDVIAMSKLFLTTTGGEGHEACDNMVAAPRHAGSASL